MKGLILAAGRGTRLGDAAGGLPKGLLPVGGRTVLDRQLEALSAAGIRDVCLATGYRHDLFEAAYGDRLAYRRNEDHAESNNIVSFLRARDWCDDDVLCLYADVLLAPELLVRLVRTGGAFRLAGDRDAIAEGHTLLRDARGRVTAVGPSIPSARATARFVGAAAYTRAGLDRLFPRVEAAIREGERSAYYTAAVQRGIDEGETVTLADVTGLAWMEIDSPEDLARARASW